MESYSAAHKGGRLYSHPHRQHAQSQASRDVNAGHLLIRQEALDATGPWHTGLRYGEDWEYWTRLARLGPFAAAASPDPLLFARERQDGAYFGMAAHPASFTPCMDAIFTSPALLSHLGPIAAVRANKIFHVAHVSVTKAPAE